MTTPYWLDLEPITPESVVNDSDTDSASDFQDSGIFSGGEDNDQSSPTTYYKPTCGSGDDHSYFKDGASTLGNGNSQNNGGSFIGEARQSDKSSEASGNKFESGKTSVFGNAITYFTSLARPPWTLSRPIWGQYLNNSLMTPATDQNLPKPFTSFMPVVPFLGPPLYHSQYPVLEQGFPVAASTPAAPEQPKKRIFSTLDTASILRTEFLGNQQSSKYLQTSIVRPIPNVEIDLKESAKSEAKSQQRGKAKSSPLIQIEKKVRAPRKQPHPRRSPKRRDPNFRGVTVKFRLKFLRRRLHKLIIKTKFCCARRTRRCRHHCHVVDSSTDDSDLEMTTVRWHCREGKQCASCMTRKTPLWRDAEDGTPLCNACGIRYKKYRIRCIGCWYVPRKANKSYPICLNCGDRVQHTNHGRKSEQTTDR